jgi:hypothetical protein
MSLGTRFPGVVSLLLADRLSRESPAVRFSGLDSTGRAVVLSELESAPSIFHIVRVSSFRIQFLVLFCTIARPDFSVPMVLAVCIVFFGG